MSEEKYELPGERMDKLMEVMKGRQKRTEIEKSWLACSLDSEGTVGIGHRVLNYKGRKISEFYPYLAISNLNRAYLQHARRIIGSGYLGESKGVYQLSIKKQTVILEVLEDIFPYLIIKRKRAHLLIRYLNFNLINFHGPQSKKHRDFFVKMRNLNLKRNQTLKLPEFYLQRQTKGLWSTRQELEDLYLKERKSIEEISRILQVNSTSVFRALRRFGILTRDKRGRDRFV